MTAKKDQELRMVRAFLQELADLRSEATVWDFATGADPPDFVAHTQSGRRLAIELVEWLDGDQMSQNILRQRLDDDMVRLLGEVLPNFTQTIGIIFLHPLEHYYINTVSPTNFRSELYQLIGEVDQAVGEGLPMQRPQGLFITSEYFAQFPELRKVLKAIHIWPPTPEDQFRARPWIIPRVASTWFSEKDSVAALFRIIQKKSSKYMANHALADFDKRLLLVYYERAYFHNTPAVTPRHTIGDLLADIRRQLSDDHAPFDEIYLFLPHDSSTKIHALCAPDSWMSLFA